MNDNVWYLKQIDLFRGLSKDKLAEIESMFRMKMYCKGSTVYHSGENEKIYLVKSGKVEVSTITEDGQKFIIDILGKGSLFGDLGLNGTGDTFVETLDDSYICYLNKQKFFAVVSREPEVAEKLMKNLFDRVLTTEIKAASFATDNVFKRFVKLMLTLGKENGLGPHEMVTDRYTHEQLAHMLGVSRQTVTTLVNQLEREGKLRRSQKRLLFNKPQIEDLVN